MVNRWLRKPAMLRGRRGIAAVMFGIMLPVFIGLTALAVDVSVIALARNQLSTAADAAALAGAMKLADENRVRGATDLTTEITAANDQAAALAQDNNVLTQPPVVNEDLSNNGSGDVLVGYIDPQTTGAPLLTGSGYTTLYNSVQVTLKRDSTHVAPVPTFFGRLMGFNGTNVTVQSTAMAQNYEISGFKYVNSSTNVNLLPIVLDIDTYEDMMAGTTTDQYSYNTSTGAVTSGSDGISESLLYPVKNGSPGNWGTIKVGVSNNSTSTLNSQILNGITPAQLATFPNSTIQLDPSLNPPSIQFEGNPGISAGIKSSLSSIIGKPVVIPIYDDHGGNGNNAWYRVIKFQPVRVLSVNFQGNPKYVIVQPCLLNDPTAIAGSSMTSWQSGGLIRVHLVR
jgi:Flp pilus assembly protein TadG